MSKIKVKIFNDYKLMSKTVANEIIKRISKKPEISISLPTGSTPIETYKILVKESKKLKLSFSKVKFFQLDEYLGLSKENSMSYYYFLNYYLFKHLNFDEKNICVFNGLTRNLEVECLFYEEELKKTNGLDLILLGIGNNGHIAFNEPGTPIKAGTRVINLSLQTINANSRFFKNIHDVPKYALTMGIAEILEAKEIFLFANGENKAQAVSNALYGAVTKNLPASYLKNHPHVTFFLDKKAASYLN